MVINNSRDHRIEKIINSVGSEMYENVMQTDDVHFNKI